MILLAAPATQVAFTNCPQFTKCITKIDGTTIDNAEDLDLVMTMYNLIYLNTVQIILRQQEIYGFIQKMKQLISMQILLMIIILNLLNIWINH